MAITFSGLSSGLDTSSLISQLVAAQKSQENPLTKQQSNLANQKQIVGELSSQVSDLGSFADGMTLQSDAQFRTASASDSHVAVAVSGDATATTHSVRVDSLARSQVTSSRLFTTDAAGVLGTGSVTVQAGGGAPAQISWDATDSLESIASKINGAKAGVDASVLYDGTSYRLMVTSSKTGTANAATFTDSGDGLALSDSTNIKVPANDAKVEIDGVTVTRPTNVIDDALSGVTITAQSVSAATDPDTQVAVTLDTSATATKLGTLVSAYNNVMSTINGQLTYTGTTAGADTLFGDSDLRGLQDTLTSLVTQNFGGQTLDALGISIDKTGVMSLDTDKLNTALAANPNALGDLFVTGGLSARLQGLTAQYTEAGDGVLTVKSQGMTDQTADLQKSIDLIESDATALQTRLQAQFTALEATMSQLNSQSTYISKIL